MQATYSRTTKAILLLTALAATGGSLSILQAEPQQSVSGRAVNDLQFRALQAVSPEPIEAATAIKALREAGPGGMAALESAHGNALREAFSHPEHKRTAEWQRLANAFEKVGAQHDNWAAGLYWFTDLDAAKAEAKKQNKPILSLRLLGNLDEELSCANSRFFRTALYPNASIRRFLSTHYILHWQSVRPVPKVTIDFGDGRKIQTTITGNSIHYVLDSEGRVLDALPGLYGPGAFFKWLERLRAVNARSIQLEGAPRQAYLKNFHRDQSAQIARAWQVDTGQLLKSGSLEISAPILRNDPRQISQAAPRPKIQQRANSQQTPALAVKNAPAPTAREAGAMPMSKIAVEFNALKAITIPIPRDRGALSFKADDDLWQQVAGLHLAEATLDKNSLEVLRTKTARPQIVAASFEKSIAEDTVRNEYSRHTTIHQWLEQSPNADLDLLNARVYSELFLTPDSDPWLGLLPAEAYTGIRNDGISN